LSNTDYRVQIYDCQTKTPLVTFRLRPTSQGFVVPLIAYCDDGRRLVLSFNNQDGTRYVEICDAATGDDVALWQRTDRVPALTRAGDRLATVRRESNALQIWDTVSGKQLTSVSFPSSDGVIRGIALSDDGQRLAAVFPEAVVVVDAITG